jgi:serine/threonine protein kinase
MHQNWIGKTIGKRYRIEALLGQGGMSAVYRAMDPNLRRPVAIKLIHPHLSDDPNFIGRFKEEAAAVARLRHPNIVQVHDFNQDGEIYFMVMDYLIGETLQARLRRLNATDRHIPFSEAINICAQICDAAGYAHKHELVHRDIKPANIMLDVNGQAILMDFGIVKIVGGEYHTVTGATVGTAKYMSPEQIRSERVDDRSDIYSLGVTMYEMISGQTPYQADSALTIMMMVLNDPLPDLRQLRPRVPDGLLDVVYTAMAKDRSARFASMAEMAAALRQLEETVADIPLEATTADLVQHDVIAHLISPSVGIETVIDEAPEVISSPPPPADHPGDTLPEDDLQQQAEENISPPEVLPSTPQTEEMPVQPPPKGKKAFSIRIPRPQKPGWQRRWIFAASALVVLLGIASVVLYISSRQPPAIQLTPFTVSPVPLNAQTAQNLVNLGSWDVDSDVTDLVFSPDGTLLGTANNRDWTRFSRYRYYGGLWQIENSNLQKYLLGHSQWVTNVAFSPDGELVALSADGKRLLIWQVQGDEPGRVIEYPDSSIICVDFSPQNLLLATGSWEGSVGIWEISSGNLLRTMQGSEYGIRDVEFSPDGSLLAAAFDDNSILIWQVADGTLEHSLRGHDAAVTSIVFSNDGLTLASASEDQTIGLWKLADGTLISRLTGHDAAVKDITFSQDGSLLASASDDATVRLWRVSDGFLLRTLEVEDSVASIALAPNGYYLAAGTVSGTIRFWGFSRALLPEIENTPTSP